MRARLPGSWCCELRMEAPSTSARSSISIDSGWTSLDAIGEEHSTSIGDADLETGCAAGDPFPGDTSELTSSSHCNLEAVAICAKWPSGVGRIADISDGGRGSRNEETGHSFKRFSCNRCRVTRPRPSRRARQRPRSPSLRVRFLATAPPDGAANAVVPDAPGDTFLGGLKFPVFDLESVLARGAIAALRRAWECVRRSSG